MVSSIASDETLKEVRAAMRGVVEEGTGRILKSRYYKVGGKTGTAQIPVNGRYTDRNGGRHYLATMVGYFPEDDPKYSCLVALKTYNAPGHRRFYYGASLAGPVFRAIADRVYAKNTAWQDPLSQRKEKRMKSPGSRPVAPTKCVKSLIVSTSVTKDGADGPTGGEWKPSIRPGLRIQATRDGRTKCLRWSGWA